MQGHPQKFVKVGTISILNCILLVPTLVPTSYSSVYIFYKLNVYSILNNVIFKINCHYILGYYN